MVFTTGKPVNASHPGGGQGAESRQAKPPGKATSNACVARALTLAVRRPLQVCAALDAPKVCAKTFGLRRRPGPNLVSVPKQQGCATRLPRCGLRLSEFSQRRHSMFFESIAKSA